MLLGFLGFWHLESNGVPQWLGFNHVKKGECFAWFHFLTPIRSVRQEFPREALSMPRRFLLKAAPAHLARPLWDKA